MHELRARAHLNLIDSSRQLFELDPGARIEAEPGWLFGAGRSAHPAISNAAFRANDALDPAELLERARAFFAGLDRGFNWRVATAAYATNGFPPEVFRYDDHDGLLADNVAAFVAYLDGTPVSIAMTIVSHGVAGIYWVGSVEEARGRGLGRVVTTAATNAGFDMDAEIASLQASRMGRPIYESMGFETICSYRLLMSPPP